MKTAVKLSSEERRTAIIRAVRRVFAEKGFHGTTTRRLPMRQGCPRRFCSSIFRTRRPSIRRCSFFAATRTIPEKIDRIKALEPSTSTLVLIVHLMVARTVGSEPGSQEDAVTHHRLMLRSMIEDGEFARLFYERTMPCWISKVEDCLKASIAAGDATEGPVLHNLGALFARHLAKTIMVSLLPATPIVDYGMPREKLVEQVVWFTLRGLGVRDEAIKRYYNPEALRVLMA